MQGKVEMKKTACVLGDARAKMNNIFSLIVEGAAGSGKQETRLMQLEEEKATKGVYNKRLKTGPRMAST